MASELGSQIVTPRKRPRRKAWPTDQRVNVRDRQHPRPWQGAVRWLGRVGRGMTGAWLLPIIVVTALVGAGYAVATSAAFALKKVIVVGTERLPVGEVESRVRARLDRSIFAADLKSLRDELRRLPLVKDVEIARSLPDTITVRIRERMPVALVARPHHTPVVVDEEAVVLGDYRLLTEAPMPLLVGWDEEESDRAAEENRRRVALYRQLQSELGHPAPDLWNKIDHINLRAVEDVVIHLTDSPETRIRLGHRDFRSRLELALAILQAIRNHDAVSLQRVGIIPSDEMLQGDVTVSYLDVSQPARAVIRLADVTRVEPSPSAVESPRRAPSSRALPRSPVTREALIKRQPTR